MRFAAPELLWLLLASPLGLAVSVWLGARRRRELVRFAGGPQWTGRFSGAVSRHRRAAAALLFHVALVTAVLALARPQWGRRLEPLTARGADIVIVLDASLSMAAEDVAPRRLEQAKHSIGTLLGALAGDRVGLVVFAGEASLSCPLTVDRAALDLLLDAVETDSVPLGGSALARALAVAAAAFGGAPGPEGRERGRAVVLFSDGEDHGGEVDQAAAELSRRGVPVYTVGCGTTEGAPIALRDARGNLAGYKKDREGNLVTTRLDESVLERLALATGGRYYRATGGGVELAEIARALGHLEQGDLGTELRIHYEERFQLPLLVAWLALAAQALIGERRRRRAGAGRREGEAA
jgi:Ca-activated chloride channel family protein